MIPKSGFRFSDEIMLKQKEKPGVRPREAGSDTGQSGASTGCERRRKGCGLRGHKPAFQRFDGKQCVAEDEAGAEIFGKVFGEPPGVMLRADREAVEPRTFPFDYDEPEIVSRQRKRRTRTDDENRMLFLQGFLPERLEVTRRKIRE